MNDDLVVQKISKLLENNTAFIGYALNGGVGTKINVRNTETGKTIQALSINVDSVGEVLVVKDSADNQYKAVTFKVAEKVSEKIIQIRKTKPTDDKKIIDYTDVDIEVFYLFVKLIDTGSPVATNLTSTWIRKGNSCTQFVGAYERCNYASRKTIAGVSYTGLPYTPYASLTECLNSDAEPDAKTPHGTSNEQGGNLGWKYFSTQVSGVDEQNMLAALTSHDAYYKTSYKNIFGYGSILECSGAMNLQGWELGFNSTTNTYFTRCEFSYLPGYTTACTPQMQAAGYCDYRGFVSSKCPQFGEEAPGQPSIGSIDSSWNSIYGWKDLSYEFMYKRHFGQLYLQGSSAPGSFYILEVNDDQIPGNLPSGYFPWVPGCPGNLGNGGPYDGSGGNRFPDGPVPIKKRDMKLSTHKAEIWLGSSKKETAIKLYELGASDLFSGMYNSFIVRADETRVDIEDRLKRGYAPTVEETFIHSKFYENWNKNIIDQRIDPKMWVYVINNIPLIQFSVSLLTGQPYNHNLSLFIHHLYQKVINLTVVDNKLQVIHLKFGLSPSNTLSSTDCKGVVSFGTPLPAGDFVPGQSWQYQKNVTITIKNWSIESTTNTLDTSKIVDAWNKDYISRNYLTMFRRATGYGNGTLYSNYRERAGLLLLRPNNSTDINELYLGNHYEQFNYSLASIGSNINDVYYPYIYPSSLYLDYEKVVQETYTYGYGTRWVGTSTISWWEMWDKTHYNKKIKRLSSIVGSDVNLNEIYNDWGLGATLTYQHGIFFQYFDYQSQGKNQITVPSLIRRLRTDPTNSFLQNGQYTHLKDKNTTLIQTGNNFFFSDGRYGWLSTFPFLPDGAQFFPSSYSSTKYLLMNSGASYTVGSNPLTPTLNSGGADTRFNTALWKNKLWAQIIYTGETKVDVDSYKDVEFKLPTNPSQYIKFTTDSTYKTAEYNFVNSGQSKPKVVLETVLSPGKLDVTKQVPIKKPTNVELDPNMSFLLYLYPNVVVTKKKKEI